MNKKLTFLFLTTIFFLLIVQQLKSQSDISGVVRDANGNNLQNANVQLLTSKDTIVVSNTVSDSAGRYRFAGVRKGGFLVAVSYSGMSRQYSPVFTITSDLNMIDAGVINLKNNDGKLRNVIFTGKKPRFEQKIDRLVINVKNNISDAGGTALDILEKSPGVMVNRQSNTVSVNGKNGVVIMINGKITYLPSDAILQWLSGTSAGNIEKIELITAPPSKYDAAGDGGFINIVLVNHTARGLNGSYFLTAGYSEKILGATGINFNYRSSRINFFGNYSFDFNHLFQPGTAVTRFGKGGDTITNNSYTNREAFRQVQNARMGLDFQLDTATIIGVIVGGYDSRWTMTANNGVTTRKNGVPDTTINSLNDELNAWKNLTSNLNFQRAFRDGKILYFDVNYMYYKDDNPNNYMNTYYNQVMKFLHREELKSEKTTPIHFWVFSADYSNNAGKKISWETGAKLSISSFSNAVGISKADQGIWVSDPGFTSNYLLNENIKAAYTSVDFNLDSGLVIKAGLRFEYTVSTLQRVGTDYIHERKYGDLFPTFYISRKINKNQSIGLSYSRRVTRPSFNDLAPFTIFFDPKTFYNGNPTLQPAIADAVQVNYGLKNYSLSLIYTYESNAIDNFYFQPQRVDTINNIVYLSPRNFSVVQYFTANLSVPVRVSNWWNMQNNISMDWREINTANTGLAVRFRHINFSFSSVNRFVLPNEITVELTGYYSTTGYLGTTLRRPIYQINGGVQKKMRTGDLLRFSANDIFNSGSFYQFEDHEQASGIYLQRNFNFGLVSYKLTYTHPFGNKVMKTKRERSTGAEEELNRVQN